ncbi:MAG: Accessory colonization factor AcfD, partial [Shewanella sp.]
MKKSVIALSVMALLFGCNGKDNASAEPEIPPGPEIPEPEVPQKLRASLVLDGKLLLGASVSCNGQSATGFDIEVGDDVTCAYQQLTLATFTNVQADVAKTNSPLESPTERKSLRFDNANEFREQPLAGANAITLVKTMGVSRGDTVDLELSGLQQLKFENHYQHDLNMEPQAFAQLLAQQANDSQADKQPSTHIPDITPAVDHDASSDLNANFVAADAESAYQYQPSETILSKAALCDAEG